MRLKKMESNILAYTIGFLFGIVVAFLISVYLYKKYIENDDWMK
jgi:uncharacterized protein YneF (UPF0154 family)